MSLTKRQELAELLEMGEWTFEQLRRELAVPVRRLEDDLKHVEKSLRAGGRRLAATEARCSGCGFAFTDRAPRRFTTPSRCPRCKSERIEPARWSVQG